MHAATDTGTAPASTRVPRSRVHWVDVVGLALLALVVRLPAYVATKALTFDDGVFANSAVAMRDGGLPFRDVFSSQGPLFLPLVALGDLLGFRTLDSPRVLAVASGIVAVIATYWAALRLTDRVGALLAGGLLAVSGGLAWVTGPLAADGPALAFAAITMGLTLRHRDAPSTARAALLGASLGAVLSTKSLEAPILVPVALVLLAPVLSAARRRSLDTTGLWRGVVAGLAALAVFLVVTLPVGFADVWDQSVVYRTDAAAERDIPGTAAKLVSTLWDRDLALLFMGAVALVCGVLARRRTGSARVAIVDDDVTWASHRRWAADASSDWSPSGRLLAVSWLVVTLVWLSVVVSPLWRPHVAAVSIPLVLVIGAYRPPLRPLVVAAVVAVPLAVVQLDGLLVTGPYRGTEAQLVQALQELPDGAWVISDEPGVVWRAGRRTTDDLVDPSMLRREQDRYTEASLLRDAQDPRVCAFVRISEQRFAHFDGLPAGLERQGFVADPDVGDGSVLYVRTDCDPSA
jgi:4-amino-4-deoxy-L-arabinose transferase-like glycosyltransferase